MHSSPAALDSVASSVHPSINPSLGDRSAALLAPFSISSARAAVAPSPSPSPSPSDAALEHYVTAAMDLTHRTLLTTVRALREPRPPIDPMAALRTIEQLMEALTGFAIGAALLPAIQRLRQAGNAEVRAAVQRTVQSFTAPAGPALPPSAPAPRGPRFLEDADQRPLVDELGSLLCARLVLARRDARALLGALVDAAERASQRLELAAPSLIAVALHAAEGDLPTLSERLIPATREAWAHASAVIDGRPRRSGAWAEWSRRAAGLPEPRAELTSSDVVAAGFVMQIG
jgi:hypothetical protein